MENSKKKCSSILVPPSRTSFNWRENGQKNRKLALTRGREIINSPKKVRSICF
jgi:hypothetical protein